MLTQTTPARDLGDTGLAVSAVGLGTAPLGYLEASPGRVSALLDRALDLGVNLIDTAACYRRSEELLGAALDGRRDEFVIVSKCGHAADGLDAPEWSGELIRASVERSLQRLRTDRIDVMLLHGCDFHVLRSGEQVGSLRALKAEGKIRFLGYSGDNEAAAYAATLPEIDVVEASVNLCDQANADLVLPEARRRGKGMIAKRPLANAAWRELSEQPGMYAEYARAYTERLRRMELDPDELGVDGSEERAWPELALRFTLSQPDVSAAIPGTTDPEHLAANVDGARRGPLPPETLRRLRFVFRHAQRAAGERWRARG